MRESSVDRAVCEYAKSRGVMPLKLSMLGRMGLAGMPDREFLCPGGYVFFVEMKKPGGACTKLQLRRHAQLRELGFSVYVCDSSRDGAMIIETELAKLRKRK